ncbi:NUCB [Mytilus edulis]|uniref:NUCB n=1 Tax=Mytilus edulis TaxID=6550 RepID=A0A8S3VIU9_MYTED|nr:NUCB [Mytilus edulis]
MKKVLGLLIIGISLYGIVCPPVKPDAKPEEGGSETQDEDTGLEYDRYLKEVVMALEEDPDFRKKLEETNATDIKNGKISMHLEMVAHGIRERLDEIKRREVDRLRILAREKMKTMNGMDVFHYISIHGGMIFKFQIFLMLLLSFLTCSGSIASMGTWQSIGSLSSLHEELLSINPNKLLRPSIHPRSPGGTPKKKRRSRGSPSSTCNGYSTATPLYKALINGSNEPTTDAQPTARSNEPTANAQPTTNVSTTASTADGSTTASGTNGCTTSSAADECTATKRKWVVNLTSTNKVCLLSATTTGTSSSTTAGTSSSTAGNNRYQFINNK